MNVARLLALPLAAAVLLAETAPAAAGPYITSRWTQYSGPVQPCLHAARRTLESRRMRIERFGPNEVIGEDMGYTIGIRCDAPGFAFMHYAFTDSAPPPARERFADELRDEFRRHIGYGGGAGGRY